MGLTRFPDTTWFLWWRYSGVSMNADKSTQNVILQEDVCSRCYSLCWLSLSVPGVTRWIKYRLKIGRQCQCSSDDGMTKGCLTISKAEQLGLKNKGVVVGTHLVYYICGSVKIMTNPRCGGGRHDWFASCPIHHVFCLPGTVNSLTGIKYKEIYDLCTTFVTSHWPIQ